ncbi:MAG: family 43 glycosylhydrolase [Bacteroidota bacterium]
MKSLNILCFLITGLVVACSSPAKESGSDPARPLAERISSHDSAVHLLDDWIRDPYVYLSTDGYYYLTGTTVEPNDPREQIEPYNTGLPSKSSENQRTESMVGHHIRVWRSLDLVDWEYLGEPFGLENGYWAKENPTAFKDIPRKKWHLWAPEMYQIKGHWTYVHTTPAPVKGGANLAVATGSDLGGAFTFPLGEAMQGRHDPSLFEDEDGTWYLLWGNTWIVP